MRYILTHCAEDLAFFDSMVEKGLLARLQVSLQSAHSILLFHACSCTAEHLTTLHNSNDRSACVHVVSQAVLEKPFATVTYTEAVKLLQAADRKFEFPVEWGLDLQVGAWFTCQPVTADPGDGMCNWPHMCNVSTTLTPCTSS